MTAPEHTPTSPDPATPTGDTVEDTTTPAAEPEAEATTDDTDGVEPEQDSPNSEAAKRRRQLRETQTELATVRDQLATYQRRHAELIISDVIATPADLFDVGHADLADYLDDNGDILTDELRTAAETLVTQRPQLGASYTPPWPAGADYGQGVRSQSAPSSATWSTVLTDQRRRQGHTQ